jgi:hypothetical protein
MFAPDCKFTQAHSAPIPATAPMGSPSMFAPDCKFAQAHSAPIPATARWEAPACSHPIVNLHKHIVLQSRRQPMGSPNMFAPDYKFAQAHSAPIPATARWEAPTCSHPIINLHKHIVLQSRRQPDGKPQHVRTVFRSQLCIRQDYQMAT